MPFTLDSKGNTTIEVDSLRASATGGSNVRYTYKGRTNVFSYLRYGQSRASAWETGWIPIGAETSDNITTLVIVHSDLTRTHFPIYQAIFFAADTGEYIGLYEIDGLVYHSDLPQENGGMYSDQLDQFMSKFSYIFEPNAGLQSVSITPSETMVNEGEILTAAVATTYVESGTTLYYSFSGSGITTADFSAGTVTGSGIVGTDGKLSISHTLANDLTTEGIETLNIKLFSDAARTTQVGQTATVSIVDTSPTPTSFNHVSVAATANGKEIDGSPVVFTFIRSGSTAASLSVNYQLFGTAKAGSDYTGNTNGSVSFAEGSSTATLSLPALADGALIDPFETIIARINPASSYGVTPAKQFATGTITAEGMLVVHKGQTYKNWSSGEFLNYSFAALKSDGSVVSWGGTGASPTGLTGVSQIFSTEYAFAALKSDGSVVTWGIPSQWGGSAPVGLTGVSQICSTKQSFAAIKSDGSVVSWGVYWNDSNSYIDMVAPAGLKGVSQIFSTEQSFAALKSDGSVISWGNSNNGGNAPMGLTGVSQIFSTGSAFAALKSDGSVVSWGNIRDSPTGLTGVSKILSTGSAFAALKSDGSVISWGNSNNGGNAPMGLTGVSQIFSTEYAFAALKSDGSVVSWGKYWDGTKEAEFIAPAGLTGVIQIFSTKYAFAALKSDGSVISWGNSNYGGSAPMGLTDVSQIFSNDNAFAALKNDGSVICWGDKDRGGVAPAGLTGVSQIFSAMQSFAALKSGGSVVSWGQTGDAPTGLTGVVGFANPYTDDRLVINGISSSYSYYSSTINKALKDWNIYRVDDSVKTGDIVNQWFGTAIPTALQTQDPTDTKLLDITTSSWTEKVKINRVAKASDKGDVIEGKQKDTGSTDIVGSVLTGGKGNDRIQAMAGWDMVDGGDGDDLVKTGNGRDILTGGTGRDELWGGFGWNTYKGDKDGFSDLIVIKSDQHLANPTLGNKAGNNSDGSKTDIIENLDSIDKIIIQGVETNQITFANATAQGLTGIGIYSKGFIEALYTGGDLNIAQLTSMTTGDTSAAVLNNTLTSYGVW